MVICVQEFYFLGLNIPTSDLQMPLNIELEKFELELEGIPGYPRVHVKLANLSPDKMTSWGSVKAEPCLYNASFF